MDKKRAVILEQDRDKRLQYAAALKGPELALAMLDNDAEVFAGTPADLYVLRAEMDGASGYSVCNRLRSSERTQGAKVVIVAADKDDPRLATHRASAQAADAYIVPPLGFKDLRLQAYSLLDLDGGTLSEEDIHAVEDDPLSRLDDMLAGAKVQDSSRSADAGDAASQAKTDFTEDDLDDAFGALDGSAKKAAPEPSDAEVIEEAEIVDADAIHEVPEVERKPSPLAQLSEEDLSFVAGSFQRSPQKGPPAPPPSQRGAKRDELRGPEAKIAMLRDSLREREQELARLQDIWQKQEKAYRESGQRVAEMEVEVKAIQMEAGDLRRKLKQKDEEIARIKRESGASTDRLIEEKVMLEKDLIEVVASKEKTVAEQRRMLASREKDNELLRSELDKLRSEYQTFQQDSTQAMTDLRQQTDTAMTDLRQQTDTAMEALRQRHAADKQAFEDVARERETQLSERLSQSEQQWSEKYNATDALRAKAEQELADTKTTLESTEAERARLEDELAKKEQSLNEAYTQIAAETDRMRTVSGERDEALEKVRALTVELDTRDTRIKMQDEELAALKADKETVAQRLGDRLNQKDAVVEQLTKEVQVSREEREALVARLGERLRERELSIEEQKKQIEQLQLEKVQLQTRSDELQRNLDDERRRLQTESETMSLKLVELQQQASEKLSAQLLEMEQLKQLLRNTTTKSEADTALEEAEKKLGDIPQP